jgi:hypothetical protein
VENGKPNLLNRIDFVIIALTLSFGHTGLMLAQIRFARHQWDVRACWYDGTYTKVSCWPPVKISLQCSTSMADSVFTANYSLICALLLEALHLPAIPSDLSGTNADADGDPHWDYLCRVTLFHQHTLVSGPFSASRRRAMALCPFQRAS